MFDAMALHPVFVFDHSAQLPDAVALPLYLTKGRTPTWFAHEMLSSKGSRALLLLATTFLVSYLIRRKSGGMSNEPQYHPLPVGFSMSKTKQETRVYL